MEKKLSLVAQTCFPEEMTLELEFMSHKANQKWEEINKAEINQYIPKQDSTSPDRQGKSFSKHHREGVGKRRAYTG